MKENNVYERKSYITINSKDRNKSNTLISEINYNTIGNNPIKIIDVNTLLINHPNHSYDTSKTTEIILKNITGTRDILQNIETIGGIPIDYLNYNNETNKPIFPIEFIYDYNEDGTIKYNPINNRPISNSYKIKINFNLNDNLIKVNAIGGGSNIIVEKLVDYRKGYEDSSSYLINLPRTYRNIKRVKLVGFEMLSAQYGIRNKISKKTNNNDDYLQNNDYIYWINKDDLTEINSNFLVNDEKILDIVDYNTNNIPTNWTKNSKKETLLYEYLSDTFINKIDKNLSIIKFQFINYLYTLKQTLQNPVNNAFNQTHLDEITNGYLVKFTISNINYILLLRNRETIIDTATTVYYFIDDFYNVNTLIDFIYKYTGYNRTTYTYNKDLTTFFDNNNSDITTTPVNIYRYIENIHNNLISTEQDVLGVVFNFLNNTIEFDYKYIKYVFLEHIYKLLEEILQFNFNYNNSNYKFISLQEEFINYLEDLYKLLIKPLTETEQNYIYNGYLLEFTNNTVVYRLYLKERPTTDTSNTNYYLDDFNVMDKFIEFIELYTSYNKLSNSHNANFHNNFSEDTSIYNTQINTPVDIYVYLKFLSSTRELSFLDNMNNKITYNYIKSSIVSIVEKIVYEIIYFNNSNFSYIRTNPNFLNQSYWNIPNTLNTNIYLKETNVVNKTDYMVETKEEYNEQMNIKYLQLENIKQYNLYPVYSVQIQQGNYDSDTFITELKSKLNNVSNKIYDYYSKIFIENVLYNNKLSLRTETNKHKFEIELLENTNIVNFTQYKTIYSYSALDLDSANQAGPFIVNEGYPYIFIKHKNHNLVTGNMINISGAANIFNIMSDNINKTHYIFVHKIFRCYIRFIYPLVDGTIESTINQSYYYEGNKFNNFSSYKSGVNRIYFTDTNKTHIGTNLKIAKDTYDIAKYELIVGKTDITVEYDNTLGRVVNFLYDSTTKNYILDYNLLSTKNFTVGMIFKLGNSNTYAMIVPQDWDKAYLPKIKDIKTTDTIIELKNLSEGYSIKSPITPNKTSLTGVGGINIGIHIPVDFSLLFNKDNTVHNELGFEKTMTSFNYNHTNTYNTNKSIIEYSYLEPTFNDDNNFFNKYIMLKTIGPHNYEVGDRIYIDNHTLNYDLIYTSNNDSVHIKQYEPFIVWYNNLSLQEQKNIETELTTSVLANYKKKGVIIYYSCPYSRTQVQHMGNLGLSIRKYKTMDYYNYKELSFPNILSLQKDSYIYINQNQRSINKNNNNVKSTYKIGLRDGYYRVLNNIPTKKMSYYNNYFDNTNSVIIECDYTTILDVTNENKLGYRENTIPVNTKISESILEGHLNNGQIKTPSINTNIVGNSASNYDIYKTKLKSVVSDYKLNLYYPLQITSHFVLTNVNNTLYINNSIDYPISLYDNIQYIIDISDISLLNHKIIISNVYNSYVQFMKDITVVGLPGITGSYIELTTNKTDNNLYLLDITTNYSVHFNIIEKTTITYDVLYKNNLFEFSNTNTFLQNPILNIDFGNKYVLKFKNTSISDTVAKQTFDNFIFTNSASFQQPNISYITYDSILLTVTINLTNNNYQDILYYTYKGTNSKMGKFIFGIYNYYNINRLVLLNSNYIDNNKHKIINQNNIEYSNSEFGIIKSVTYENMYYFSISTTNKLPDLDVRTNIIPQQNIHFMYDNTIKNQNLIKIKKTYELFKILGTNSQNNTILLQNSNNLNLNDIITINDNIDNTGLLVNEQYYIIYNNTDDNTIKLGTLDNKAEVSIISTNSYNTTLNIRKYTTLDYLSNELNNKFIKINYLCPYNKLVDTTYNENISIINNDTVTVNISNNSYYTNILNNESIISNTSLINLNWKTPYGGIKFKLSKNSIINNITIPFVNSNNSVKAIYLYYYENNKYNLVGSIADITISNLILNSYNKKDYLLYFETKGYSNNIYSELFIPSINISYYNQLTNVTETLNKYMEGITVNNVYNENLVSVNYLDLNLVNELEPLILNTGKSSIITMHFEEKKCLRYYKIVESTIKINNVDYYKHSKINSVQLFGSDYIDFDIETEITGAKYIDTSNNVIQIISKTFSNNTSYKYYRFKLMTQDNAYPYESNNINNVVDINNYRFSIALAGLDVGELKKVNYADLYIEDVNYIENIVENNNEYMTLKLKFNLLNSHIKNTNIIIGNTNIDESYLATQHLIIYNNWYTRVFYKGYNTIYDYYKLSKTFNERIIDYSTVSTMYLYGNSKVTVRHSNYLDIYKKIGSTITSITETNSLVSIFNVTKVSYVEGNDYITVFTVGTPYYINKNNTTNDFELVINILSTTDVNDKSVIINDAFLYEGIPIVNDYLSNNIYINNMNGFYIPETEITIDDNLEIDMKKTSNMYTPIINNNYDTTTYNYLDLVFKTDDEICNSMTYKEKSSGLNIKGYYKDSKWHDGSINNKDVYYVNYNSITLKGKYMGFSGEISNKTDNNENIINKTFNGYDVLDIGYDENNIKNKLKIDLKLENMGINGPENYFGNLDLITEPTIKNKYLVGYSGSIHQKKIYKDVNITGSKYIYLSIDKLNNIVNTNKVNIFSKIFLNTTPGNHIYNSFVDSEIVFDEMPLEELADLNIKFLTEENKLFNFERSEHTFTLEITELVSALDNHDIITQYK